MHPLGWFRSNKGGGAWLAFFALACQLVLTFGHVHFAGSGLISAAWAGSATTAIERAAPSPASPEQQPPSGLTTDFCAVCSNIALANALVLPDPPRAGAPVSQASDAPWLPATAILPSLDHFTSAPAVRPRLMRRLERLHRPRSFHWTVPVAVPATRCWR
jgi:hypothetical protein